MTNTGTRVKGHRRTVRGTGVRTQGMFSVASGYVADCSCGWSGNEVSHTNAAAKEHAAHKDAVLSGAYAEAVEAERARRRAVYLELLAEMGANGEQARGLTREQVQGWLDDLPAKRISA